MKIGIIGMGNMGQLYTRQLAGIEGCQVTSIWSQTAEKVKKLAVEYGVNGYTDYVELLDKEKPDAVIVATPHYQHEPISIEALKRGIHVLVEKPMAVHVAAAKRMLDVYEVQRRLRPGLQFAAIHQQRTEEHWRTIKTIVASGRLGKLLRFSWTNTGWFRPQAYFQSSKWRGTWQGEGGGVLLNQCAHNLDMMWWLFGSPASITAHASFGKYHHIEVEDEVQALLTYDNGLVGSFTASTAEFPGTDRLEIAGELGKLIYEDKHIRLYENAESALAYIHSSNKAFGKPAAEITDLPVLKSDRSPHMTVLENFVRVIREGGSPLVPASESMQSLMIINGMLQSALQQTTVRLPLDGGVYEQLLERLIRESRFQKPETPADQLQVDIQDSFR